MKLPAFSALIAWALTTASIEQPRPSRRQVGDTRNYQPRKPQPHGRGKKGRGGFFCA